MVLIVIVASVISARAGSSHTATPYTRGGYVYFHTVLQCWISVLVFMVVGGMVGGQINRRWNLLCIVLIM